MLRVVPLFETLDDLNHAETAMRQLFSTPWYSTHIQGKQVRSWGQLSHLCGLDALRVKVLMGAESRRTHVAWTGD